MRTAHTALVLVVAVSTFVPSRDIATECSLTLAECVAARVADAYVAIRYPDFDTVGSPPVIRDTGDTWEVEYQLPSGVVGGTPVIVVEKANLNVVHSFHTQ
jgi:hypothetical protein